MYSISSADPVAPVRTWFTITSSGPNWFSKRSFELVPGGPTALHFAAAYGGANSLSTLLGNGANIEALNISPEGFNNQIQNGTPLHYAAIKANEEGVRVLVEAGADIEAADSRGCTPLLLAAQEGSEPCVCILLKAGAKKEAADSRGCTPLLLATVMGNVGCIFALLRARVNLMPVKT